MRPKSLALLLLALGCGLVASIGITEVMSRRSVDQATAPSEMQSIFVAMNDIPLGDLLTPQILKLEQWPRDKVPHGAISRIEDVEGRRARTKLYAGEPILENRLLGKGASEQGATALIPKGYRVVPVKVDLVSGGSSMIVPGDRVDVMIHLVRDPAREIQETVTRTILQDIKVFAVDDVVDLEKEKEGIKKLAAKTISLLVTPDQAAKLMLATQLGTINLVMRSPEDDKQVASAEAKPGELFGTSTKSARDKETLMAPEEKEKTPKEPAKGFLDFLGAAKAKPAEDQAAKAREMWIMRILKPGDVAEVQFEAEETKDALDSPFGAWKVTSAAGGSSGAGSGKESPKTVAPPSPGPTPPAAGGSPTPEPSPPEKNKSPNGEGPKTSD
jgi:pilus assembly protein CpaB